MPIVSRKEFFEEYCGFPDYTQCNMYVNRGKVSHLPDNKKLIDTDNPLNAAFAADKKRQNSGQIEVKPAKKSGKTTAKAPKKPIEPAEIQRTEKKIAVQMARDQQRVDQDMKKKALEIENLELERQKKILMLEKAAGQLIPVDLLRGVVKRNADSMNKSFEKGIETLITIMVQTTSGGDPKIHSKFLGMAKKTLSDCIQNAGIMAEEEITILVNEFSQTLGRGQRRN